MKKVSSILLIMIAFIFVVSMGALSWVSFHSKEFVFIEKNMLRSDIHEKMGQPCDERIRKLCDSDPGDDVIAMHDSWADLNILGRYLTRVNYNRSYKVISQERKFEWFYERFSSKYNRPNGAGGVCARSH